MTRTSDEWRDAAEQTVEETLSGVGETFADQRDEVLSVTDGTRQALLERDMDRFDRRHEVRRLENALVAAAHELLDAAYDVRQLRSGSALRNLDGEEPLGYSKPDAGATTDAHYGSMAMDAEFARRVSWPLDLGEWDTEKAPKTRDGYEPVEASGIKKYTRYAGGRTVSLVLGEPDPPV